MQRKTSLANEEYYHVFNRGVDKRSIFLNHVDYERFKFAMYFSNSSKEGLMVGWRDYKKYHPGANPWDFALINADERLVEIISYCLNENHYHMILMQKKDNGIESFMQKLGTSYTMYFNKKYKRSGSLFQGPFKSVHIENNEHLLYVSSYVNMNHYIHGYDKTSQGEALRGGEDVWRYSSWPDFHGKGDGMICNIHPVFDQFKDSDECKEFFEMNAEYLKEKKARDREALEFEA